MNVGESYSPANNWTSILRSRAGHPPYTYSYKAMGCPTTFTMNDKTGRLLEFLRSAGYAKASTWKSGIKFHVEVSTSEGALDDSQFFLASEILMKVRPVVVSNSVAL